MHKFKQTPYLLQNIRSFAALSSQTPQNDFYEFENFNDYQQFSSIQMDSTDSLIAGVGVIIIGTTGLYYYNEKVLSQLVKYLSHLYTFITFWKIHFFDIISTLTPKIKEIGDVFIAP